MGEYLELTKLRAEVLILALNEYIYSRKRTLTTEALTAANAMDFELQNMYLLLKEREQNNGGN